MNPISEYLLSECEETIHGNLAIQYWKCEEYAYYHIGSSPSLYGRVHAFKAEVIEQATKLGLWVL